MTPEDRELYEQLAAIEHDRWAHWQRHIHEICGVPQQDGGILLPAHDVTRWERQLNTPYADLTETEKDSDRREVDRYWHLIRPPHRQEPSL